MQRIPLSKETACQRLLWCQAWKEDLDELLETISATNRQFNRNLIINEVGYSASLMRSL
ncbi:hypothetical protein IWW34DRAFT_753298 [Fusarium oxysporum f. sp. albedinis]|nr:hypothetical protein IWW34DRAFT_753298 [Fusarium oxysporum f. sp. albedinis]